MTISWQSFEASDASNIGADMKRLQITNGILYVQLVPTTDANTPAVYTVEYNSNGKASYTETWAVPPSVVPLRVQGCAPGAGHDNRLGASAGRRLSVQIADVVGLQNALNIRPYSGTGFTVSRAAVINSTGSIDGATGNPTDCLHVDGTSGACGTGGSGARFGHFRRLAKFLAARSTASTRRSLCRALPIRPPAWKSFAMACCSGRAETTVCRATP